MNKLDDGKIWETSDGNSALIVFGEGCCLVAQYIDQPKWLVCALPHAMSDAIRSRDCDGDLSIDDFRDGADIAIVVTINDATLAFCSTVAAQRFLPRRPTVLFTE